MLSAKSRGDLLERGFTRRDLARITTLLTAGAALPFFNEGALAQLSSLGGRLPPDAVKINANENPLGPSPRALEALIKAAEKGGRYQYHEAYELAEMIAHAEGLEPSYVIPYPGSSIGLHHCVIAFTSPAKGLVTADPGYEAAAGGAWFVGAKVSKVPLKKGDASHDVRGMLSANPRAGLFYVCNPNNPTGTITPRKEIEHLVENKPAGSIVLLDEAYIHFSDEPWGTDLVKAGKDVVIMRTFSKVYGMAGLRAGYALGRPDLLSKMRGYFFGALPATAMAAAKASLDDKDLVPARKKTNREIRDDVMAFLKKRGYDVTPSVSCKFMVDTHRPVREVIRALAEQRVFIGRPWPAWPTWARISIGAKPEMERFKAAFLKVMS